jgi:hypothetical protein
LTVDAFAVLKSKTMHFACAYQYLVKKNWMVIISGKTRNPEVADEEKRVSLA